MLFGEYSVLTGSNALTIPYAKYSGHLVVPENTKTNKNLKSNRTLLKYFEYLRSEERINEIVQIDFNRLGTDLMKGLYFDSYIPVHYGLGSSGALVAALFKEYADKAIDSFSLLKLRDLFSLAESFFHGRSSGIDPLTIYIFKPLLFIDNAITEVHQKVYHKIKDQFYLYDSGIAAATDSYVTDFHEMINKGTYAQYEKEYMRLIDKTILKLANDGPEELFDELKLISRLQFKYFSGMIPERIVPLWEKGLDTGEYSMKLCGSGGGGYFLVYSQIPIIKLQAHFNHTLEVL